MTNPQIGNTGVNGEDEESERVWLSGFIVRELSPIASSWRSEEDLDHYLSARGVAGISGVDTRALTRELRAHGALGGVLSSEGLGAEELVRRARDLHGMVGRDLVREVTRGEPGPWNEGSEGSNASGSWLAAVPARARRAVVAYDFGIKRNILRRLVDHGFAVTVVPASTPAASVLALAPDGVFLSNGPGDPAALTAIVSEVKELLGRVPIFGICLGHQLIGQALGARTFKLKFGHHGGNHPVRDARSGKVEITAQNHGFAVDPESLPAAAEPTHWNLNDGTLEGFRHRDIPLLSVQYHPEAAPGPHDSHYLFEEFRALVESGRATGSGCAS